MSASPRWHARIDVTDASGRGGSGFLIDAHHVLTCAHVVGDAKNAAVSFLLADKRGLPGEVVFRGPWVRGVADEGDIAVIRLTDPVDLEPARLAPWNGVQIYAGQRLSALGFPDSYRDTGQIAHFTAVGARLANGTCQTDAIGPRGPRLDRGYSGSAAYLQGTDEVVGMMTAADRDPEMRTGMLLPLDEIGRHWPPLLDRICLGPFGAKAYRELHAILHGLELAETHRLLLEVLRQRGPLFPQPPAVLSNVLAAVEWLAVGTTFPREEVVDLVITLLRRIGQESPQRAALLHEWVGQHGWGAGAAPIPAAAPGPAPRPGWVVVRIAPTAGVRRSYHVTIWTATDPDGGMDERILEQTVTEDEVKDTVERSLPAAYQAIPHATYDSITVEFVLPLGHLAWPVDDWRALDDLEHVPLGWSRPVVVRALDWFDHPHPRKIQDRAERLRADTRRLDAMLEWLDCAEPERKLGSFQAWLRMSERRGVLGLAGSWATPERISSAVASGLPVLLWPRAACHDHSTGHGGCAGVRFRTAMAARLGDIRSDELPLRIRDLRVEAGAVDDEHDHCGREVTLLWDDPRRRPVQLSFAK
ncbi:trypsin-like peptidase domain-containing protein [Micromonospora echinofusca]|uniref:Trypsin-like peptidase domain-containing protein n=1 Tax=Micromonospora echinofusca TaxID=47858 RepID=A0A1C5G8Y5_MICEH|nr:trypsin-like peptidase domain-containing protein [Micromonospora echinofusca]SCG16383.1 Trypsin-like peptidase domain-containing protein [Micromonospora echinofusca]